MSAPTSRTPRQILTLAEQTIRIMLGRGASPAEIAQALDDHALLTTTVRPGIESATQGGVR